MNRWPLVVLAACKLHNYCVDLNVPMPDLTEGDDMLAERIVRTGMRRARRGRGARRDLEVCPKRVQLTAHLDAHGFVRGATSQFSKATPRRDAVPF